MALINQNSIIGVTSITSPSASNVLTVHTNDTTERLRVSTSGVSFSGTNASLDTSGNATFNGNVSIGGTLTYEDVTNIDSVGIITARLGIEVPDSQEIKLGDSDDLQLWHNGSNSFISNITGTLNIRTTSSAGDINLNSNNDVSIKVQGGNETAATFTQNGAVKLFYDNSEKFKTTSGGVEVSSGNLSMQSNGRIFVGNGGNATNPMFANVSDTNTGIAFPAADTMMFTTGGSERLRITSAGKLLIGSDTGSVHGNRLLQVGKTDRSETYVSIVSSTSGESGLLFADTTTNDTGGYRGQIRYHHSDDSMNFRTGATEQVRITSGGNVGINETSPYYKLHIKTNNNATSLSGGTGGNWGSDGIRIENTNATGGCMSLAHFRTYDADWHIGTKHVGTNDSDFIFLAESNERLRITSDGKVGINDTSPAALFTVNNGTTDSQCVQIKNDNVGLFLGTYGTGHGSYPREATINGTRTDSGSSPFLRVAGQGGIKFCVDLNSERMRIQPSGYVGIGENAPGGKLTVKHANTATSGLNATLKLKQGVATNGNRSSLIFSSLDDFDVAAVNGVVEVHAGTSSNNVGRLEFWTKAQGSDAAERLRITSGGHVNIGGNYTQTSYHLQVDGNVKGDSFTGESLSNRTGYKWGASGIYYLTLGGSRSGNASSFTMFELTGMNNSKFVEIQISFAHAGGGSHGSYRRAVYTSNGYQGLNTLENVTSNYGGGSGFTINKPSNGVVRVVWNGCTGFQDGFQLCCQVKTSNSTTVFQNVDSAFG